MPVAAPRSAGRWPARFVRFVVPPTLVAAGVVCLWLFVTYSILQEEQRPFLPPPQEVVERGFLDWARLQPILEGFGRTAIVSLVGLAIAFVIGTCIAVVMSQTWWLERTVYPYAVILQTVPLVAIAPLVGLKMGYSDPSRVVICVLISIFPIIANTLFGLKSASPAQHDLFTLQRASRWTRLWRLQFPTALPAIFTGLRISAGLSVIGAIVGEFFYRAGDPSKAGLGRQLSVYQNQQRTHLVITALFFSCLLGVALFAAFSVAGNQLTKDWTEPVQRGPGRSATRRPATAGRLAVDN